MFPGNYALATLNLCDLSKVMQFCDARLQEGLEKDHSTGENSLKLAIVDTQKSEE